MRQLFWYIVLHPSHNRCHISYFYLSQIFFILEYQCDVYYFFYSFILIYWILNHIITQLTIINKVILKNDISFIIEIRVVH